MPKCIYGKRHWYAECRYLDASAAPAGWKESLEIRKQVDEFLADPKKKTKIKQILKNNKKRKAK